jgi:Large extracellular alpha-helical protein
MRRYTFLFLIYLLVFSTPMVALDQPLAHAERLYVITDKPTYIAGESLWGAVFCVDAQTRQFSNLSSVAYVELCDAQESVWQGKVALQQGRGSLILPLPSSLATGNYLLRAYTRYMQNEGEQVFFSRIVSIYNVLSTDKTEQTLVDTTRRAATVMAPAVESPLLALSVPLEATPRSPLALKLQNLGSEAAHFTVSVYAKDALDAAQNPCLADYLRTMPQGFLHSNAYIADYEGEIVYAKVLSSQDGKPVYPGEQAKAYLSVVGHPAQVVEGQIDAQGNIRFFTSGIYGVRDAATELFPLYNRSCQVVLQDAFVSYTPQNLPSLRLYPDTKADLQYRSLSMQLGHHFFADTLHHPKPTSPFPWLTGHSVTYVLNDYTRFPVMRELFIEFISEARVRQQAGRNTFIVRPFDGFGRFFSHEEKALVLLDGIPVFDHDRMLNFDPLLIERITVYDGFYNLGGTTHCGVIDFKTYKKDLGGMSFPENLRITSFNGLQYPLRFTSPEYEPGGRARDPRFETVPDWRHTLYWKADACLEAGAREEITCYTSDYKGNFVVVLEGMTSSGKAFRQIANFKVQ